jgi:putative phosphoesterase
MMKLAFLSDIHANLHALQAVWEDLDALKPDAVYCLGDLVGYGAFPNEVIEFIMDKGVPTVMGNYDEGVGFDMQDCGCVYKDPEMVRLGQVSLRWTKLHTTQENKTHLQSLPIQIRQAQSDPSMLMVHGSPRKINEYLYEDRPEATFHRLAKVSGADILLFGHTHLAYKKKVNNTLFINTGSVGKPKDGDARAGYVLLTLDKETGVEFRRVSYDVEAAADAIRHAGLPDLFASQLVKGGR